MYYEKLFIILCFSYIELSYVYVQFKYINNIYVKCVGILFINGKQIFFLIIIIAYIFFVWKAIFGHDANFFLFFKSKYYALFIEMSFRQN